MKNSPGAKAQKKAKRDAANDNKAELETWTKENTNKRILIREAGFVPVTYPDDDQSESSDSSLDSLAVEKETARLLEKQ